MNQCDLAPTTATPEGSFTIDVVNDTDGASGFDLWLLHPGVSYADWVAYHEEEQRRFDAGAEPQGEPRTLADPVDLMEAVGPNAKGQLGAHRSTPGSYVLQCWRFTTDTETHLFTAGPIVVR